MLCPVCTSPLDANAICSLGHTHPQVDGVLRLIEPRLAARVERLEHDLVRARALGQRDRRPDLTPAAYDDLPGGEATIDSFEWRLRRLDLRLVLELLDGAGPRRILDCGAWNGWLSHQLARRGHDVTAAEFFAGEVDGLGAVRHYRTPFRAIQMDLGRLDLLEESFDLVVVNHGLAFFPDPVAHVDQALRCLGPGGVLVCLGLQFFRDPRRRVENIAAIQRTHREHHGEELFLRPTRGLLCWRDRRALAQLGLRIVGYRGLWWHNLRSLLRPTLPRYCFGVKPARPPGGAAP